MKKQTGIIILEGADASGKTTLAKALIAKNGGEKYCEYYHAGIKPDLWALAKNQVKAAIAESNHKLVILDRNWISECCYGPIFRDQCQFPNAARSLDRLLLKHAAVTVLCVIENQKWHIDDFECLKLEREEEFNDIGPVVNWYYDLAYGNMARPATNYAETFIARGDLSNRPDFLLYDRTKISPEVQAKKTLKKLKQYRSEQHPYLLKADCFLAVGHCFYSSLVFIEGKTQKDRDDPWPFFGSEKQGFTGFFNEVLQSISFNEADAMYVSVNNNNTFEVESLIRDLRNLGKSFIVLDDKAAKICKDNIIVPIHVQKPDLWKNFRYIDRDIFREDLRSAIVKAKILETKRRGLNETAAY